MSLIVIIGSLTVLILLYQRVSQGNRDLLAVVVTVDPLALLDLLA